MRFSVFQIKCLIILLLVGISGCATQPYTYNYTLSGQPPSFALQDLRPDEDKRSQNLAGIAGVYSSTLGKSVVGDDKLSPSSVAYFKDRLQIRAGHKLTGKTLVVKRLTLLDNRRDFELARARGETPRSQNAIQNGTLPAPKTLQMAGINAIGEALGTLILQGIVEVPNDPAHAIMLADLSILIEDRSFRVRARHRYDYMAESIGIAAKKAMDLTINYVVDAIDAGGLEQQGNISSRDAYVIDDRAGLPNVTRIDVASLIALEDENSTKSAANEEVVMPPTPPADNPSVNPVASVEPVPKESLVLTSPINEETTSTIQDTQISKGPIEEFASNPNAKDAHVEEPFEGFASNPDSTKAHAAESDSREFKSSTIACDPKHRHLFFDCD